MQLALTTHQSDSDYLLAALRARAGEYVPDLYRTCGVMVHSRVADLRKRGCVIECKRFGKKDYRYRLTAEASE